MWLPPESSCHSTGKAFKGPRTKAYSGWPSGLALCVGEDLTPGLLPLPPVGVSVRLFLGALAFAPGLGFWFALGLGLRLGRWQLLVGADAEASAELLLLLLLQLQLDIATQDLKQNAQLKKRLNEIYISIYIYINT